MEKSVNLHGVTMCRSKSANAEKGVKMNSIQNYGNFNVNQNYGKVRKSPNFKAKTMPKKTINSVKEEIKKLSHRELILDVLKNPGKYFKNKLGN